MASITLPILRGTKAAYAALATKNPGKIYLITDAVAGEVSQYLGTIPIASIANTSGITEKVIKDVGFDTVSQKFTFTYTDDTTKEVDLVLESVIQSVSYDSTTQIVKFTLVSGTTTDISLAGLMQVGVESIEDATLDTEIPSVKAIRDLLSIGTF